MPMQELNQLHKSLAFLPFASPLHPRQAWTPKVNRSMTSEGNYVSPSFERTILSVVIHLQLESHTTCVRGLPPPREPMRQSSPFIPSFAP